MRSPQFCPKLECGNLLAYYGLEKYCLECESQLCPMPKCECGYMLHLKRIARKLTPKCPVCEREFTSSYLGLCMARSLRLMVEEIAKQKEV